VYTSTTSHAHLSIYDHIGYRVKGKVALLALEVFSLQNILNICKAILLKDKILFIVLNYDTGCCLTLLVCTADSSIIIDFFLADENQCLQSFLLIQPAYIVGGMQKAKHLRKQNMEDIFYCLKTTMIIFLIFT
jgi:hypothetical protein